MCRSFFSEIMAPVNRDRKTAADRAGSEERGRGKMSWGDGMRGLGRDPRLETRLGWGQGVQVQQLPGCAGICSLLTLLEPVPVELQPLFTHRVNLRLGGCPACLDG